VVTTQVLTAFSHFESQQGPPVRCKQVRPRERYPKLDEIVDLR